MGRPNEKIRREIRMANLLERMKNTFMADVNELLEKKENKNPIALLNQYVRESEKEADKVKKLIERQYRLKEEFFKEYTQAQEMVEKRKKQADIAEAAGEQELLVFAQLEQKQYEERVSRLKDSLSVIEKQLRELETKYMEMCHKLKDMKIRQMELMAKENSTKANHTINKVLEDKEANPLNSTRFSEMEKYVDKLEKKINAAYYQQTMEEKLAELEKEASKKEEQLS